VHKEKDLVDQKLAGKDEQITKLNEEKETTQKIINDLTNNKDLMYGELVKKNQELKKLTGEKDDLNKTVTGLKEEKDEAFKDHEKQVADLQATWAKEKQEKDNALKALEDKLAEVKANEVNARVGPSIKTPIEWVFVKKGEPVEIIAEYEQWRQIRDIKGEGGWVHSSVLSGKRSVIVVSPKLVALTRIANDQHKIVARVSNYVRCLLNKCKQDYCQVCCKNYTGWLPKTVLWGVYKDETKVEKT
jgi:SH3-like domain-containing protein